MSCLSSFNGVANGDFTLDNVKVEGRLVVRGGGKNSIKITNKSSVGNIVISKSADGEIRVAVDSTSSVEYAYVPDGKDGVIVEGAVTTLTISGTTDVEIKGTIKNVVVTEAAAGAKISVASGTTVEKMETNANNVSVSGEGKITEATVNGDSTAINVVGTKVNVDKDAKGTTTKGKTAEGGTTVIIKTPTSGGSSGGEYVSPVVSPAISLSIGNAVVKSIALPSAFTSIVCRRKVQLSLSRIMYKPPSWCETGAPSWRLKTCR